jgi:hypothetical protein
MREIIRGANVPDRKLFPERGLRMECPRAVLYRFGTFDVYRLPVPAVRH